MKKQKLNIKITIENKPSQKSLHNFAKKINELYIKYK